MKVQVDVLGSPSLITRMVSVDVKHHLTRERQRQRQRDGQIDRQSDRDTERHRQTDRQRQTERKKEIVYLFVPTFSYTAQCAQALAKDNRNVH